MFINMNEYNHIPVLLSEVLETFKYLNNTEDPIFVDGTLGLGGHSLAIAEKFRIENKELRIIGIDKDREALKIAQKRITENGLTDNFVFIHDDFKNIKKILDGLKIKKVDGILLDLGVSSMQLDEKERGFSFTDPSQSLDMRMDQSEGPDAYYFLNHYSEKELDDMLFRGEDKYHKLISKNIVTTRRERPVQTVGDLLQIIEKSLPKKMVSKFPNSYANGTFRAVRLEVNQELTNLDQSLKDCVYALKPTGKLAVISFHSLEDRIVKNTFRKLENPCSCPKELPYCVCEEKPSVKILTKKPQVPSEKEISLNLRSRSSKFRVVEKI